MRSIPPGVPSRLELNEEEERSTVPCPTARATIATAMRTPSHMSML